MIRQLLSNKQYTVLRSIAHSRKKQTMESAEQIDNRTLASLVQRKYLHLPQDGYFTLTEHGYETLHAFEKADLPERNEAPLSPSLCALLGIGVYRKRGTHDEQGYGRASRSSLPAAS